MVAGHRANALLDARAARVRRHQQLRDLASVHAEPVQQLTAVQVPQADGKVDAAGQQVELLVARVRQRRTEQTVDAAAMAGENLMRRPLC